MNNYNNLKNEESLYLQDHKTNPINWYPWNPEVFKKAKDENKPIFLSIGYSTCHWCHVMKRESFENTDISTILNNHYIAIKVDREERPDIDLFYMEVALRFIGYGGWPLNVIITPNQEPIFITTYLPKEKLERVLSQVNQKWQADQNELIGNAKEVIELFKNEPLMLDNLPEYEQIIKQTKYILQDNFDALYGGFKKKPKFPTSQHLLFLLYYYKTYHDEQALKMGLKTLYQIYKGGIFDHINYGISRYSVDQFWLAPHFEKMLYDNAMILVTYLLYYYETKDELLKNIALKIINFLDEFLKNENSTFYSAIDADSQGIEGKYYLWSYDEIYGSLPLNEANLITKHFNITKEGNHEGQNILNLIHYSDEEIKQELSDELQQIIYKLKVIQQKKASPRIDKKILTSWNSMAIWAYSLAGKILNNNDYILTANKTVDFILDNLIDNNKELYTFFYNKTKHLANLDDYAYFINSLIELYLITSNENLLEKANELTQKAINLFYDNIHKIFYFSRNDNDLIIRPKELFEGPTPSGNSMMIYNLVRLNNITYEPKYVRLIKDAFRYMKTSVNQYPTSLTFLLLAFLNYQNNRTHIIFVYTNEKEIKPIKEIINTNFNPYINVLYLNKNNLQDSKLFEEYYINEDFATFICVDGNCDEPIYNIEEAIQEIKSILSER